MLAWLLILMTALAQDAVGRATPQEVLSLASSAACPDVPATHAGQVVRTSIGLAVAADAGEYSYVCPSRVGDDPEALAAASPDGRELLVAGDGGVFWSTDRGCSAERVAVPDTADPIAVLYWRSAFWVLTRDTQEGVSTLVRVEAGLPNPVVIWPEFVPDGMAPEGNEYLWVAGAAPSPQARRLSFVGGLSGDEPPTSVPEDLRDIERVVPVIARDNEVWLRIERRQSRWLWQGEVLQNGAVRLQDMPQRPNLLLGPVFIGGRWVVAYDLVLHQTPPKAAVWSTYDTRVAWTCLGQRGERVFACTVNELLAVTGIDNAGVPTEVPAFSFLQLGPPDPVCGATPLCDADWQTYAGGAGLLADGDAREVAVCPDGRTVDDLDAPECQCNGVGGRGGWVPLTLIVLFGLQRRRFVPTGEG